MDKGKAAMGAAADEEGVDELLAALGYRVRASDMTDVAQKLEQLETAMAGCGGADDAALLPFDTVHYNPSDISTWLDSMLSELNAPPPSAATGPPTSSTVDFPTEQRQRYDLEPIPDALVFGSRSKSSAVEMGRERKRMRGSSSLSSSSSSRGGGGVGRLTAEATKDVGTAVPVVVVADAQEAGVRLVHALVACAEAVQCDDLEAADALLKQISVLAAALGGAMRKVAGYFAEALARRIYRLGRAPADAGAFADVLYTHFYESCPYLKFAHFTANQAILEAVAGRRRVHVIDFGIKQGMQWPALMQALALRPDGPPFLRLTGIGPPRPDGADALQQVGWKLARLADTIGVGFEYQGLVANSLADVEPFMLRGAGGDGTGEGEEEEAVAVNAVFELHPLLARAGAVEKVLRTVRAARPRIVTVVEQEADHNVGTFAERFSEALHYYSTVFDSLEGGGAGERAMAEVYVGREICNVVACEGADRTERHERVGRWRRRMAAAGFAPVHLGSNAFKQATMLLALFAGGEGYGVEEKEGCLTLGWHTRPLIATSAWRCLPSAAAAPTSRHVGPPLAWIDGAM